MGKTLRRPARRPAPRRAAGAGESDATNRTIGLDDRLYAYLCRETLREPELMARLRAETSRLPRGTMQISPEQGQFMRLLVRLIGAPRARDRHLHRIQCSRRGVGTACRRQASWSSAGGLRAEAAGSGLRDAR